MGPRLGDWNLSTGVGRYCKSYLQLRNQEAQNLGCGRTPPDRQHLGQLQTLRGVLFSHRTTSDSATPWTAALQASLSITNSWSLLTLMSIQMVVPSSHLILCGPLLLPPSIFPSIRVFSKESALHIRWPKYWSFSFGISPSDEYSGLISSRIDWFVLLAVKGTLKNLVQHGSSEA